MRVRYKKRRTSNTTYVTSERYTCESRFYEDYPDYFFVEWVK